MTDKCQAPGLECEDCRLKCQLPLIEAEKAQRERVMNKQRDYEKDWQEFCLTDGLTEKEMKMRGYLRYWMFEYSLLKAELNRLQVALEATIAEKERCRKLAVDWSLRSDAYKLRLELCENMKLAHEFEDLLQTTSIPVAVERLKQIKAEGAFYRRAFEEVLWQFNYGDESDYVAMRESVLRLVKGEADA